MFKKYLLFFAFSLFFITGTVIGSVDSANELRLVVDIAKTTKNADDLFNIVQDMGFDGGSRELFSAIIRNPAVDERTLNALLNNKNIDARIEEFIRHRLKDIEREQNKKKSCNS